MPFKATEGLSDSGIASRDDDVADEDSPEAVGEGGLESMVEGRVGVGPDPEDPILHVLVSTADEYR